MPCSRKHECADYDRIKYEMRGAKAGLFTVLVIVLALAGKLIGGFIGSKLIGFEFHDSLIFGIGMMPRCSRLSS